MFEFDEYIDEVVKFAKRRQLAQGAKFSEVDFFTGAMVVFEFLTAMDKLPAAWVFMPLAGKSILSVYEDEAE